MTATTNSHFDKDTEAVQVAAAFPDAIKGKTILITGVNKAGLGYATAEAFASQGPAHLIFSGRTLAKLEESIAELHSKYPKIEYHPLVVDLSSQASVRTAAKEVLSWNNVPQIDIIVNNAGIMNIEHLTLTPDTQTELHFATNHIGHFMLTNLLMPKLLTAAKSNRNGATRIVNLSSSAMFDGGVRFSDINFTKPQNQLPEDDRQSVEATKAKNNGKFDPDVDTYVPSAAYAQSKTAVLLFSVELTKRLYEKHGILSVSVDPGVIMTELGRAFTPETMEVFKSALENGILTLKTHGAGAATSVVAAIDPALGDFEFGKGENGKEQALRGAFLCDCQIADAPYYATGSEPAERLWKLSEDLVGETFAW